RILLNENGIALRFALALGKLRNGLMLAGCRLANEYRAVNRPQEFQTREVRDGPVDHGGGAPAIRRWRPQIGQRGDGNAGISNAGVPLRPIRHLGPPVGEFPDRQLPGRRDIHEPPRNLPMEAGTRWPRRDDIANARRALELGLATRYRSVSVLYLAGAHDEDGKRGFRPRRGAR